MVSEEFKRNVALAKVMEVAQITDLEFYNLQPKE